jgi:hypothetical protein
MKTTFIKSFCLLLLFCFLQNIMPVLIHADNTPASLATPAMDVKVYNANRAATVWWADNFLVKWSTRLVTRAAIAIKNAFEALVDLVFDLLCKSLLRLWDVTQATHIFQIYSGTSVTTDTGVGVKAADYVNNTVMPFLYVLVGCFLYLFVVLKLLTNLFRNESSINLIAYCALVVFFVIAYTVFYSVTIQMFSNILGTMGRETATIKTSTLGNNFAATLTGDEATLNLIASGHHITDAEIDSIYQNTLATTSSDTTTNQLIANYANNNGINTTSGSTTTTPNPTATPTSTTLGKTTVHMTPVTALWVGIIVELGVSCMFVFFIIQLLLMKGQQIVQLFLSYFLGILIIPLTVLSGPDLFIRWIKSFVGVCLQAFVWGLLFMLLYTVSLTELGGLDSALGLPSILQLMMYFGVFMLMTQVGKLTDFFTGGDTFGKITQSSSREFGSMLRGAGTFAAIPAAAAIAPVVGMAGFAGGLMQGMGVKMPGLGNIIPKGDKTGSPGTGTGGGPKKPGGYFEKSMGTATGMTGSIATGSFGAGAAAGSFLKNGASDIIKAIRQGGNKNSNNKPNDGSSNSMPENFRGA